MAVSPAGVRESADAADLPALAADPEVRLWVDLTDPTPALVEGVAAALGLHPLVAEDIVERNQRAKIEFYEAVAHLVLFGLVYSDEVELTELDFVLGSRFLLSAHEATWDPLTVEGFRFGVEKVLAQGADFLLWALADSVVDAYFPVLDRMDDELDRLEDDLVDRTDRRALQRLFGLKRELIELRRVIVPTRETVGQLTNRQLPLVAPDHVVYFRDVYDHLIRASEDLDTLRDLASGTLDIYLSQVNNNLSLIMKRLTGVTVILAGIGAVAGIFGMSEAGNALAGGEASGFWLVTAFVVGVALTAALILHRFDWI
jgi:magnesium transporter